MIVKLSKQQGMVGKIVERYKKHRQYAQTKYKGILYLLMELFFQVESTNKKKKDSIYII